jgi:hypothetical protein
MYLDYLQQHIPKHETHSSVWVTPSRKIGHPNLIFSNSQPNTRPTDPREAVSSLLPPLPVDQEPLGTRTSRRSFRVELGSVSNRSSFDYRVDEEVEAIVSCVVYPVAVAARPAAAAPGQALAEAVGSSRGWLGEYLDRVARRRIGVVGSGGRGGGQAIVLCLRRHSPSFSGIHGGSPRRCSSPSGG